MKGFAWELPNNFTEEGISQNSAEGIFYELITHPEGTRELLEDMLEGISKSFSAETSEVFPYKLKKKML